MDFLHVFISLLFVLRCSVVFFFFFFRLRLFLVKDTFVLPATEYVCSVLPITFFASNEIEVENTKETNAYFAVGTAYVVCDSLREISYLL
jgi:hypothetical protein